MPDRFLLLMHKTGLFEHHLTLANHVHEFDPSQDFGGRSKGFETEHGSGDAFDGSVIFQVLTGHGASINTRTPEGKLVFGIFIALAEFERALISERTKAGLASARARGRNGGGQYKMTPAKLRLAIAAIASQGDFALGAWAISPVRA